MSALRLAATRGSGAVRGAATRRWLSTTTATTTAPTTEASAPVPEDVEALKARVADLAAKHDKLVLDLQDANSRVLYALSDAENARRIAKKDVEAERLYGNQKFAKSFLDVADNLKRAVDSAQSTLGSNPDPAIKGFVEGITAIEKEFSKAMTLNGVLPYGEAGEIADPNRHEILYAIPNTTNEKFNTIKDILRGGYEMNKRVLRVAQVAAYGKPQ